jgi:hypothetical protein
VLHNKEGVMDQKPMKAGLIRIAETAEEKGGFSRWRVYATQDKGRSIPLEEAA